MEQSNIIFKRATYFLGFTTLLFGGIAFWPQLNIAHFALYGSERITWAEAQTLQAEYLGFKPFRVKYTDLAGNEYKDDLKGFVFTAAHLDEIINHNASGTSPDEVYFSFGQDGTFTEGPFGMNRRANLHIIAMGMSNKQLLTSGATPSIFDKADPCPPNCPR